MSQASWKRRMPDAVASILLVMFLAIAVLHTYSLVLEIRRFGFHWEEIAALFWPLFYFTFSLSLARASCSGEAGLAAPHPGRSESLSRTGHAPDRTDRFRTSASQSFTISSMSGRFRVRRFMVHSRWSGGLRSSWSWADVPPARVLRDARDTGRWRLQGLRVRVCGEEIRARYVVGEAAAASLLVARPVQRGECTTYLVGEMH